jgi:hypothetical protein
MARKKMNDTQLLSLAQSYEADSAQYVNDTLQRKRTVALNDYNQRPYGNEQEGWSGIVTSDVFDTVEGMLPDLLDLFMSSDKAVVFEPTRADQVEGAKQATAGANHVFYQMNNGFLVLYTAFKDALIETNCAVHWYKQTEVVRRSERFKGATAEQVAMLMAPRKKGDPEGEVDEASLVQVGTAPVLDANGRPQFDTTGQELTEPLMDGRVIRKESKPRIVIDAFEPENLYVLRSWTSPLLGECPYVCRSREVTLSELNQMAEQLGFPDVTATELASSTKPNAEDLTVLRARRNGDDMGLSRMRSLPSGVESDDPASTTGWIRYEWMLVDKDGDGFTERRFVLRLQNKILYDEECDEVPICTGTPIIRPHTWDGMSVAEEMSDLQLLHTELMRGVVNNAYASNNPRKVVLTDNEGNPFADVDDLLDGRMGGVIRTKRMDGISMEPTAYVGNDMEPLLQRVDQMKEQRSGFTKQRQGIDPNSLREDRTLGETQIMDAASKQRIKLMGRILGETIVVPIFRGVNKLLTSGDFDKLFLDVRGEFVEYDPNEWDDGYRMRCTVGLGTGDTEKQQAELGAVFNTQLQLMQSPLGPLMVEPDNIFNTLTARLDLAGFKNPGLFFKDPKGAQIPKPPPQPPIELIVEQERQKGLTQREQAKLSFEAQKTQFTAQQARQAKLDTDSVQAANDERDTQQKTIQSMHEQEMDALKLQLDKYVADLQAATSIQLERMRQGDTAGLGESRDEIAGLVSVINELRDLMDAPTEIVRDANGAITGSRRVRPQQQATA